MQEEESYQEAEAIPQIEWHLEKRKVADLKDYPDNPRIMTEFMYEELKKSIIQDGIYEFPYINTDNTIIGGHQRKNAFLDLGIEEVFCAIPERTLTEEEARRILLKGNKIKGDFDQDMLRELFEEAELLAAAFQEHEIDFDAWKSDIEDGDGEPPEEPEHELVKLHVPLGERGKVVGIVKEALEGLNVRIE